MEVYYIGGSPGSGKSTLARMLSKEFGFAYYKLDDHLFSAMKKAAKAGKPHSLLAKSLSQEETWMRDPQLQADEEFQIYDEIFPYALDAIEKLRRKRSVVAEGAGFTPLLMARQAVPPVRYVCIVPTEAFQRKVFAGRTWTKLFLRQCQNPSAALENWMRRDALFAGEVLRQAQTLGYEHLLADGSRSIQQHYALLKKAFALV